MAVDAASDARQQKPLWLIILSGGTILAICLGIRQSFGLFLDPVSRDLGLGREVFSLAMGLQNLVWGFTAPLAGAFADKHGAGRVVFGGALFYALGLVLMAGASDDAGLISSGALLGLGVSGTGFTVVLGAVGRAAPPHRRGSALGLASMGGSIGQFIALPYAHSLLGALGWVSSLLVLAATAGVMAGLAWGLAGRPQASGTTSDQSLGEALREAVTHRSFLLLNAGFFVCGFHITFIATHLPAFLADRAFEPWVATLALSIIGVTNIAGTYLWARAGDRIEKRSALCLLYLARAALFLVILYLPLDLVSLAIVSAALGFLWLGTFPLTSGLVATLFGPKWMSMLFGVVFFTHQLGSFLGVWLGGYLYDRFQSYDAMWWLSVALGVLAALLHWPIEERPVERLTHGVT